MIRLGFFGEAMLEGEPSTVLASGDGLLRFGGDTLNTAVYLARLARQPAFAAAKLQVHYFTALGQDQCSTALLQAWQQEGVVTDGCQQLADKTVGSYQIMLDAAGERRFCYQRADSAARYYFREPVTALERQLQQRQLDWCYLSGISLAILPPAQRLRLYLVLRDFVGRGGKLVYDNNFRPQLWSAAEASQWQQLLLPWCQLALLTDSDEQAISGLTAQQSREAALAAGVQLVLVKQGAKPCLAGLAASAPAALSPPEAAQCWQVEALPVAQVVDTSAAGDSFAAGVLACWLAAGAAADPALIRRAMQCGHRLAATVLQQHGAVIDPRQMPEFALAETVA